jgi:hypothetical protein
VDKFGRIGLKLSSAIAPPSFTASGTEGRRRRLRGSGLFEKGGYETEFSTELSEVAKIDQMLKLTNSVKVEIIPGSNENLANMNFTWQVVEI